MSAGGASSVVVLGRGRVGRALEAALRRGGVRVVSIGGRADVPAPGPGSTIVLAVPDGAVSRVAKRIARHVHRSTVVVHCAGALSAAPLAPCAARGAAVGVMHPLVSFPTPDAAPPLTGTTWIVAGDARVVRSARRLAHACGARVVVASVHGPAYHAAAAMLANGAAALSNEAVRILVSLGISRRDAERAIASLLASVAHNVGAVGVPRALTGPIVRGDADTVAQHRAALRKLDPRAARAYDAVAPLVLAAARDLGMAPEAASRVRGALTGARSGTKPSTARPGPRSRRRARSLRRSRR